MAPNGEENAFTVTGKRYCGRRDEVHFENLGKHGPLCKSQQEERDGEHLKRCKRETQGELREREGRQAKGGETEQAECANVRQHSDEREEGRASSNIIEDGDCGGGT